MTCKPCVDSCGILPGCTKSLSTLTFMRSKNSSTTPVQYAEILKSRPLNEEDREVGLALRELSDSVLSFINEQMAKTEVDEASSTGIS